MQNPDFNSPTERMLVAAHKWLDSRIDLHTGFTGKIYRYLYFLYKDIADKKTIDAILKYIHPGTFVIDVGANIGSFSRTICLRSPATVLAFEPEESNFRELRDVIVSTKLTGRVLPHMYALSDNTGTATLYLSDLAPTDHKLINSRSTQTVNVDAITLDDFMSSLPEHLKAPVSFVKIDVQGGELMVLSGMKHTLTENNFPPIMVEYSPSDLSAANVTPDEFFDAFHKLGYRPHQLPELAAKDPSWFTQNTRAYRNILMISATSRT